MGKNKGAVLTGVILMVLVMTLIGVPLLGMVVYNYRLRELSNSIKRAEYENEMAMDVIAVIVRETVIQAISDAKDTATTGVNEIVELQRSNYSSLYGKYTSEWINEYNLWESKVSPNEEILGGFLALVSSRSGSEDDRTWWNKQTAGTKEELKNSAMGDYVSLKVNEELEQVGSNELSNEENASLGNMLDENGVIDEELLNAAYNTIFKGRYQASIVSEFSSNYIVNNILTQDRYDGIVNNGGVVDVTGDTDVPQSDNYLKIATPKVRQGGRIEVDTETRFKKNSTTPPTTLSATFVIGTPEFDSVSSVTQESITLSNALLNQGGVIVGGKINVEDNTTVKYGNNITVLGGDNTNDTAIEVKNGAKLIAETVDGLVSNSRVSTAKDIVLNGNTVFNTGTSPIYYRNLYVGNSNTTTAINVTFNGDAVAEDDLEINSEGTVSINQDSNANYYGFNDTNNKGPDSSSSIVLNSKELSNKSLTLGNLYLAGRAFIEDVRGTSNIPIYNESGILTGYADTTYKTGESIAIKGNYLAYQTPLFDTSSSNYMFSPDKIIFSTYFMSRKVNNDERQNTPINLADGFSVKPDDWKDGESFDVNRKWRYFSEYARLCSSLVKSISVTSNVRYIEGTAFDNEGKVIGSSNVSASDTSFRNNLSTEYEKYTKYFGYRPIDETGAVDMTKARTNIFGDNGWIKSFTNSEKISDIEGGKYYLIFNNGSVEKTLSGSGNKGIIICKGDLTLNVSGTVGFKGILIVGGNLTVKGGTLVLEDAKDEVINTIIANYLGTNTGDTGITGVPGSVFDKFAYDGSGSTYIVTEIGDELININDLIGITNWRKSNYGRL